MPQDGCFIHYLTAELNNNLQNYKINKIFQPSSLDCILELRGRSLDGKTVNKKLLISSKLDAPRIHLTNQNFQNPENPNNFCMVLRKYIERGIIKNIRQYQNDRIIILDIASYNELEDETYFSLIIEIMGRNSNIILVNNENIIIDAIRKLPPSEANLRTIIPHAQYLYPDSNSQINPFDLPNEYNILNLQGVSKSLHYKIDGLSKDELTSFLNQQIKPIIYNTGNKLDFYAYPLDSNFEVVSSFDTLSDLLENYYKSEYKVNNCNTVEIENIIKKEIKKTKLKLSNLYNDIENAKKNIGLYDEGIILQANLYRIKKGDTQITLEDFMHDNKEITISLNPLLEPSSNLKVIFNKAKKAKNALVEVDKQIKLTLAELDYLETIFFQLSIADNNALEEIRTELTNYGYLKRKKNVKKKNNKITLTTFEIDGLTLYLGKNNIQNEYVTHTVSSTNDYWFHVKDIPGSHLIVKVPENNPDFILSEEVIRGAANIAAYFSKAQDSSSVPVDYTKIRFLKKIPGQKGYHVILTNQKTIYIDPDINIVNKYLKS